MHFSSIVSAQCKNKTILKQSSLLNTPRVASRLTTHKNILSMHNLKSTFHVACTVRHKNYFKLVNCSLSVYVYAITHRRVDSNLKQKKKVVIDFQGQGQGHGICHRGERLVLEDISLPLCMYDYERLKYGYPHFKPH